MLISTSFITITVYSELCRISTAGCYMCRTYVKNRDTRVLTNLTFANLSASALVSFSFSDLFSNTALLIIKFTSSDKTDDV